ncbi:FN3 associated domain-containing protein [Aquimarina macrocephali]|uniref:FN3 associated domain-containing protein n=1 Tax=Aquimarina macrocephali TaxID=666563 RepID=UPI00046604D6|nr:c-type cytochrome domain-containing protein [Aquimarina macrocephali]
MNFVLFNLFFLFSETVVPVENSIDNIPEFVLFLGRFHPLILHLPIGGLLLVFYFDVIGRIRKKHTDTLVKTGLGFSAIFACLACILGYFLSLEGGYEVQTTNIHMWTGIGTSGLIILLYILKKQERYKKLFFFLFVTSIILIGITGHYGSVLTHGDSFITQYSPLRVKKEKPQVIDSLRYFSDVVHPILDAKCIQCHNATKQKGELSLISEATILEGGENGRALQSGKALNSRIIKRILLPLEDEKHMPPEGKNQITSDEIWLLKHWIDNGADFNKKALAYHKNDTLTGLLQNYLKKDTKITSEASVNALNDVIEVGFLVNRIVADQPYLRVKYVKDSITEDAVTELKEIADQLVELDLNNTLLTDDMTKGLRHLKKIKKLRLDNTKISDATIKYLEDLEDLEVLNIYNTLVGNKGIASLIEKINLTDIYVWNTKVDESFTKELMRSNQTIIHNGVFEGFTEIMPLKPPKLITEQTIFSDSLIVAFDEQIFKATIRYTLDGTDPDSTSVKYTKPIKIADFTKLKAKMYKENWLPSPVLERDFFKIKHEVKNFDIVHRPSERYPGAGKIFDFIEGSLLFSDGKWTGYEGENLITTINFDEPRSIENVSISCLQDSGSWILFPKMIEVYVRNENTSFKKISTSNYNVTNAKEAIEIKKKHFTLNVPKTDAKYIKVVVHNLKKLPSWHQGAGKASWLFVDEILIW